MEEIRGEHYEHRIAAFLVDDLLICSWYPPHSGMRNNEFNDSIMQVENACRTSGTGVPAGSLWERVHRRSWQAT